MSRLEEMAEMSYEAYVPISSKKILGKSFGEIENQFALAIVHYHNSPIENSTRKEPTKDIVITPGMSIKVVGDWDEIDKFRDFYDLF